MIGFGDLYVISEDVVKADLERCDSCARTLTNFDLGNVLTAVAADVAQFIQLRVEAVANRSAIGQIHRRLIGYCSEDARVDFGYGIQLCCDLAEASCGSGAELQRGDQRERSAQGEKIARTGSPDGHLRQQTLQIENAAESLP